MSGPRRHDHQRERQVPAKLGQLDSRAALGVDPRFAQVTGEQVKGVVGGQHAQAEALHAFPHGQAVQAAAAGDDDGTRRRPGQQRPDLLGILGVVQHDQHAPLCQQAAVQRALGFGADGEGLGVDIQRPQDLIQGLARLHGRVPVKAAQVQVELPVRVRAGGPLGPAQRERGLADAGHAADRRDHGSRRALHERGEQAEFGCPAGEQRGAGGQLPRALDGRRPVGWRGGIRPVGWRGGIRPVGWRGGIRPVGWRGGIRPPVPGLVRDQHPALGGRLLDRYLHPAVGERIARRAVPHHLVEEPGRRDERQHPRRRRERRLELVRLQQPERQIDARTGHPLPVVAHLTGMQRYPQPDLRLRAVHAVMLAQRRGQPVRERLGEQFLRHVGRRKHQDAVTAIFAVAADPRNAALAE